MLDIMRKHAKNWLMKAILGIIIIVFVFYFGSMGGRQKAERIAIIDGKPIVYAEFLREYQNLIDMYRQRFGQSLTDEMLNSLNLKQQALDNLINQAVISKKAEVLNVRVTDEDIKMTILAYPGFQRDGAFDQRIYEQTLRANKMTPEEFEEMQRKMLIATRVEDLIRDAVRVSDQEVHDLYQMQSQKINIDFIQVSPTTFTAGIKTTPADLEAFLKAQEGQFRVPEQVQIKYLAFLGQDYATAVQVSDSDVADYYERHKDQWTQSKGRVRLGDGSERPAQLVQPLAEVRDKIVAELARVRGMYAAADEAKKAHDTIYQEENFDAYAAKKKVTVRTTGLIRINDPPPEFRAIADFGKILAGLQKNEISRVIQGEKGYYLITVADRKAPYLPSLKEIEPQVEKQYREVEAKKLAQKEAETLLARLKKGDTLEVVAREKGLKITETGLFQPGGAVPKLGSSTDLTDALFQISEKKPYPEQVYPIEGNYVIIRLKERGKLDDTEFASRKDSITQYLKKTKQGGVLKAWIEGSKAALIKDGRLQFTRDIKDL
jgi:peptidyl-prolyl cis-trans isomerase D